MNYYSTNHQSPNVSLSEAVIKGLAPDKGLYMPERIDRLPHTFFDNIHTLSFQEIAFEVAKSFFGEDIPEEDLRTIVYDTLAFDTPVVKVSEGIFALELFHGPTLAFKDVGGRFMARLLSYFLRGNKREVSVLVATSGDTGSAVANGFLGVEGIRVFVLYPKGKVSEIQEKQFTTLGQNITAIAIDGVFDDCQALVKRAFLDEELNECISLSSANSINVARFLPQSFYYFWAYAQLKREYGAAMKPLVVSVPSGNFGNITAGLIAQRMGLPISRFIAANNANSVFYNYLTTGNYEARPSVQTIANAMDVGDPSNFVRVLDLYGGEVQRVREQVAGCSYSDEQIGDTLRTVYAQTGYLLDPHGACGYRSLEEGLHEGEWGVFLETAHPAKFKETVDELLHSDIEIPAKLQTFMKADVLSIDMNNDFEAFKQFLLKEHSINTAK